MCRIEIVNHLPELPTRVKFSIIVELEDGVTTAHTLLYRFPEPEADDPENPTFDVIDDCALLRLSRGQGYGA